jgi:hypothetical protein
MVLVDKIRVGIRMRIVAVALVNPAKAVLVRLTVRGQGFLAVVLPDLARCVLLFKLVLQGNVWLIPVRRLAGVVIAALTVAETLAGVVQEEKIAIVLPGLARVWVVLRVRLGTATHV